MIGEVLIDYFLAVFMGLDMVIRIDRALTGKAGKGKDRVKSS